MSSPTPSNTYSPTSTVMLTEAFHPDLPEWLQPLYPFRTHMLLVGGYRMSFVDEGSPQAAPLVLLHGNPTWSFLYRNLIPRARERYRVIAPDHIGFGLSDKPESAVYHSLAQHISNFTRLIETLGLKNVTLVMHGWGGPIGLGYAVAHPENVARLVLVNTWASNPLRVQRAKLPAGLRIAHSGRLGAWLDSLLNLSMHSYFSSRGQRPIFDMALEAYTYPFPSVASRIAPRAFTRMFFDPDRRTMDEFAGIQEGLQKLDAPASILWGVLDRILGKLPAYILRDELKHAAEPVFLPGISHYLPEQAPDVLADVVLEEPKPAQPGRTENVFKIIG